MSFRVHRGIVPLPLVVTARRRLLLELRRCGVTTDDINTWAHGSWWPSLREEPEFVAIQDSLAVTLLPVNHPRQLLWAEPQLLVRLPDELDTELGAPHLDELPPWAGDQWRYSAIVGVELTDAQPSGGSTVLYPTGDIAEPVVPLLRAGDALVMSPELLHSGSPNHSGDIRMALFLRLLEQASS